ncbi:dimethylaniline monooxygenase [N-oxide-forming] 1-like [Anneissia japonica]|uniref:dimethylaniline monooxygenase [N-oxide-forming] 1-like n=1 Tax=Anneissia japonica TaxID=1529436 RepID=UPI00142567EA|nr:dimethylaniline monooxygenase [N-oxide-forming] 1-like [Anneissia japonica]
MAIKTVGIVGAGVSGLVSIKSCLEEDLQPICFERSSGFTGELFHSQYFRRGSDYAGKTVVVLGAAFSGGDVSVDCSRFAKMTYMSTRRGCWVLKRGFGGKEPWDKHILSQWFNYMPECFQELYIERVLRRVVNHEALGLESDIRLYAGATIMINDSIDGQIYCGKLKVKPGIERLTKTGVVFTDGSHVDNVDVLVTATGYLKSFPFIESKEIRDSMEELQLYKYIFNPDVPTLAAIGLFKGLGTQANAYEMQSRYVVRIFSGKLKLPSKNAMRKDIKEVSEINIRDHGSIHSYMCIRDSLHTRFPIAMKLAFGTLYPYIFRIQGPHSWDGAMDALLDAPRKTAMATKMRVSKVPYRTFLHTLAQVGLVVGVMLFAVILGLFFKM